MILLDAYAARSCPVKVQNEYDPTTPEPSKGVDASVIERFNDITSFKTDHLDLLATAQGARDLREAGDQRARLTAEAVAEGAPVIVGPRLPRDETGQRRGHPDALVRGQDRPDGNPGYHPVQVKKHKVLEKRHPSDPFVWVTPINAPFDAALVELSEHSLRSNTERDLIQLAHYVRMLEAAGWAGERQVAGLVSTDRWPEGLLPEAPQLSGPAIIWVDLTHRHIRTFSRTADTNWKLRSAIERYDHEFSFRLMVAHHAAAREPDAPYEPRVQPIVVRECETCHWWPVCEPKLGSEDLSLRITRSPLDVREITVLRRLGVSTLDDLADADLAQLKGDYLPEVRHRADAEKRLDVAAQRSRMIRDDVTLARLGDEGPIRRLPSASIEVDLDIETSGDGSVYLWGLLVNDLTTGQPPSYHPFVAWGELDVAGQAALAAEAMSFLAELHERAGGSVRVYHYSDYEAVHLRKLAAHDPSGVLAAAVDQIGDTWVDLYELVRANFFGVNGLGLKVVAVEGPGFGWRDDEPGGLASQTWFSQAIDPTASPDQAEAARARVLDYNEDDVMATFAVRQWLRQTWGATES